MPFIMKVADGKLPQLNVFGSDYPTKDGTGVRDYIHVVDLSIGHIRAIERIKNTTGITAYNLGTGVGYSVLDIVNAFERVNEVKVPFTMAPRRAGDVAQCYADPEKAGKELCWQATRGLDEMCRDSWNYVVHNR